MKWNKVEDFLPGEWFIGRDDRRYHESYEEYYLGMMVLNDNLTLENSLIADIVNFESGRCNLEKDMIIGNWQSPPFNSKFKKIKPLTREELNMLYSSDHEIQYLLLQMIKSRYKLK